MALRELWTYRPSRRLESPPGAPPLREDRRIKVATLVHVVAPGGAETIALASAVGLDRSRFRAILCVGRDQIIEGSEPASDSMFDEARAAEVDIIRLRRRSRFELWAWLPMLRMLRGGRVDVLHAHLFGSNVWACVLGKIAGVPVIICHEHMWSYGGSPLRSAVDRWFIARASSGFIAVSEAGRRSMVESEGIPEDDVILLRNGVRSLPPGTPGKVRAELGIGAEQPVVATVGILRPEKAHSVLVEAAARLVREGVSDLCVLIAGEGAERQRLEALIDSLDLAGTVRLLGIRRDIPDLLEAADIAVCCSDFEGGPLSVMEYMEAGLPIVATEVGGLPELVHPDNGILIPPRDPAALADAIMKLAGDPDLRCRMGAAGRGRRDRDYDISVYIERLEALYERLLSDSPSADRAS